MTGVICKIKTKEINFVLIDLNDLQQKIEITFMMYGAGKFLHLLKL